MYFSQNGSFLASTNLVDTSSAFPYNSTNEIDSFTKMSAAPHSVVHATNFVPEEDKKDDNGKGTVSLSGQRVGTATGSRCGILAVKLESFPRNPDYWRIWHGEMDQVVEVPADARDVSRGAPFPYSAYHHC
jgi:hypothetical protein